MTTIVALVAAATVHGAICALVAAGKNRSALAWLGLGLALPVVALVCLLVLGPRRDPGWTSGVRPYAPLAELAPVADDIWCVDGPVIHMALGPVHLPLPTRMVVVRLSTGGLWIWSPIAPSPELFAAIDALGPVEHLVSPNKVHYAGIPAWKQRYPQATAWASPGVRARARSQRIDVPFDADLDDAAPAAWSADIDQLVFRGSRYLEELVFFHRPSATVLFTDLVIALEPERLRRPLRWLYALLGMTAPGHTPRELPPTFWGRKDRARASLERVVDWQPRRVLFAHGRPYLDDPLPKLERAFAWIR